MTSPFRPNVAWAWPRIAAGLCAALGLLLLVVAVWKDIFGQLAFFPLVVASGEFRRLGALGTATWFVVLVVALFLSGKKADRITKMALQLGILATVSAIAVGGLLSFGGLSEIKYEMPELRRVDKTVYRAVSYMNWSGEYQVVLLFACDTTGLFCRELGRLVVVGEDHFELRNAAGGLEIAGGNQAILTNVADMWQCPGGIKWILECNIH